ncbi:hypothetical protein SDC9_63970 [bioreactor metagenome]|uniref:Uncharacterized protein n=1 Tax=bioreactor metagenome TaxID=1076179 RepID=A0A644XTY5_9ZZZZ
MDDIQAECVKGANPHGRCSLRVPCGESLAQLVRRLVGKRENKNGQWVHAFGQKALDALHQGARLARSRPGLQLECRVAMIGRCNLGRVRGQHRDTCDRLRDDGWLGRHEQCIQKLLLNHLQGHSKACSDIGGRAAAVDVMTPRYRARQEEFACKKIHPDLPAFPGAVVEHTFYTDRCILGRAVRFDFLCYYVFSTTFQDEMSKFVRYQEGVVER